MEDRLHRLQRLTGAMQARKRAHEFRMAQINHRLTMLASERAQLVASADGPELFTGSSLHYVKRLEGIDKQVKSQQRELEQLKLLQMKAAADLRRSEISMNSELAVVQRLREARYLEQVVDTSLLRRGE